MRPAGALSAPLRVGVMGGVPASIGGHGLELQLERTVRGLRELGHEVVHVDDAGPDPGWDVLHAFGSEGDVQHLLSHWTRNRVPLVITPVLVVSPGRAERVLRLASRWPGPATHAALRRRTLRRADALIAGTAYEQGVLRRLAGPALPIAVVPNGADVVAPGPAEDLPDDYVLLLGSVSARKAQAEVVRGLGGAAPAVVAGGFAGSPAERAAWEATVAATGTRWLGHVGDPARIARLLADAVAMVHLSEGEVQSLAVVEALAAGTRVVLSDIPSHQELAADYPDWVTIVRRPGELPAAIAALRARPAASAPPRAPTWRQVAERVAAVYASLGS